MPSFRDRCDAVDPSLHSTAYRQGSHGATHPSTYALGRFVDAEDARGAHVLAFGDRTRDETEPYETAALWLHMTLDVAAMTTRRMPWTRGSLQPPLDSIVAGLAAREEP